MSDAHRKMIISAIADLVALIRPSRRKMADVAVGELLKLSG